MGFARAGAHRSKSVTVWQQGGIRLVVNTEATGFARTSYIAHGTGVCEIGLLVDNAADTVARAWALDAEVFAQPTGPGELDIPGIRGLSGSVMHFIEEKSGLTRVWDVEFEPKGTDFSGAGLTRIDHIAQTMDHDEMLSCSLFYITVFDLERAPTVDVVDPDGLVRSAALRSPDGGLRLTLNGAEIHRTLAGRFVEDSARSAVQHVAFATDDIFASFDAMVATGFAPLPITGNYYDDLAARSDFEDGLLARMRDRHILYDRDGDGEFFQVYSRPTPDGPFFEIVERRGGYDGYGAPNAPFRIVAQKRLGRPKGLPKH